MPRNQTLSFVIAQTPKAMNGTATQRNQAVDDAFDPTISFLAAFNALPVPDREAMFEDFRKAATEKDLRQLLDTISDWAATAELYANASLGKEFEQACAGRQEVAEWLTGK